MGGEGEWEREYIEEGRARVAEGKEEGSRSKDNHRVL